MKRLFIPLTGEWFDKFASGEKTTEYRIYGPRWNEATCWVGRPATLSRGYGKATRLNGHVSSFRKVNGADLSIAERETVGRVFGSTHYDFAIIGIEVTR